MPIGLSTDTLRLIPLLRGMNETEYRQMSEVMRPRSFAPGDFVIRQGEQSRDLWVVLEGQCEVLRHVSSAAGNGSPMESLVLTVLEPFTHFGEMSFFHPAPHSADVRARSHLSLLQITHADYADMIAEGVWAAYKLAYNVVQELAAHLRRMDQWVSELANNPQAAANVPEFSRFRSKLFDGFSL